jgi:hypothetical protein
VACSRATSTYGIFLVPRQGLKPPSQMTEMEQLQENKVFHDFLSSFKLLFI